MNVRQQHVLDWLNQNAVDVLCLQETKQEDSKFPFQTLADAGYYAIHAGQKTYNGVAILSKHPFQDITIGIPGFPDEQKRVIVATINDVRIICAYIPNGQSLESDKYQYKLKWLKAFTEYLRAELLLHPKLALLGDYNIAPEDRDVHDPKVWQGQVLVSAPERQAFQDFLNLGLTDSFRLFEQVDASFSWWDYRMAGFRRNLGLRIDHILISQQLVDGCKACWIDKTPRTLDRPSDHTPVIVEIEI